jgi:hypothetical protein
MKLWTINLMLLVIVGSALGFAQSQPRKPSTPSTNDDGCNRYKIRVVEAPAELDKSMDISQRSLPRGENIRPVEMKGIVIDPCRKTNLPARVKPTPNKPFQIIPATPKLPLVTPSPAPNVKPKTK